MPKGIDTGGHPNRKVSRVYLDKRSYDHMTNRMNPTTGKIVSRDEYYSDPDYHGSRNHGDSRWGSSLYKEGDYAPAHPTYKAFSSMIPNFNFDDSSLGTEGEEAALEAFYSGFGDYGQPKFPRMG